MTSTARYLTAASKALALTTALAVAASTTVLAQTADSTQPPPGARMGGGMGPNRGMRPRFVPGPQGGPRGAWQGPRDGGFQPGGRNQGGRRAFGARQGGLMRGITLSTEQEKALRTSRAKQLLEAKPLRMEMLSASTDQQLARLNGDQKALDAATARLTATRTKLDSLRKRQSPLEGLRSVLTPDQQKILDKNLADRPMGRRGPGMGPGFAPGERPGQGIRFRDGGAPRGMRSVPPPRRPAGNDSDSVDRIENPGDR